MKLTDRQTEVLTLVSEGWKTREIAKKLSIEPGTVCRHRDWIFFKLRALNSPHAVAIAMREGIL